MSGASGEEIDHYFAVNHPHVSIKILCHNCGGVVANSAQQLKAEIAALANELSGMSRSDIYNGEVGVIIERMRQLSAV